MQEYNLDNLVGKEVLLYGICGDLFKISVDGEELILRALEDPEDGYRSSLDKVEVVSKEDLDTNPVFFGFPFKTKCLKDFSKDYSFRGHSFIDEDNWEFLTIGTMDYDDYYPCYIFSWSPKPPKHEILESELKEYKLQLYQLEQDYKRKVITYTNAEKELKDKNTQIECMKCKIKGLEQGIELSKEVYGVK